MSEDWDQQAIKRLKLKPLPDLIPAIGMVTYIEKWRRTLGIPFFDYYSSSTLFSPAREETYREQRLSGEIKRLHLRQKMILLGIYHAAIVSIIIWYLR